MLTIRDIHTYYGSSYVLQGISLEIPDSRVTTVLGRNGMGKTTLIRSVIGFTNPKRGQIYFRNKEITKMRPFERVKMGIGLVPQGRRIFQSLTVKENLQVSVTKSKGKWNLEKVYNFFPRLEERSNHAGRNLSGGEQQMLAIGRALMQNPDLLLLDEPTEGLSPLAVKVVHDIILLLKEEKMSILLVEQNLPFALNVADDIHVLSRGRVVQSGTPSYIKKNEDIRKRYLGI